MKFTKFEGIKNDFIISENIENLNIVELCDRNKGIGADGLILINNREDEVVDIDIYNSDGSIASTCGNGLRCVGAYLKEKLNKNKFKIRTISGIYKVNCISYSYYP